MLAVIAIQLHYLAEVNLGPKVLFDSRHVEAEPVSCQLDALRKALFQITNKRLCVKDWFLRTLIRRLKVVFFYATFFANTAGGIFNAE